jgi:Kelch motif/Galactose oxidase, central domain
LFIKKLCAVAACALVLAPAASAASGWAPTGSMATGRGAAQAAVLADGRVLVAGGIANGGGPDLASSEIYDPATGAWSTTGSLGAGRHYASLTRLPNGRVLIAGGLAAGGAATTSAELYDPATGTWSPTGSMADARDGHGATLLPNGKVLVAGGGVATAELYDPGTSTWSPAGTMATARENHVQELLANGEVLVAGGFYFSGGTHFVSVAELYDPATNSWSPTGSMATARTQMASVRLGDGSVLAAGGVNGLGFITSAERYDPVSGTWSGAGSVTANSNVYAGVPLPDGRALVVNAGGGTNAALFDPAGASFSPAGSTSVARTLPTVTALPGGRVLVAGGIVSASRVATAEVWTPATTRAVPDADFGALRAGGSAERDLTVSNTGALSLWVDGVGVGGADAGAFAIVADGCGGTRVAAGASCTVRVRFTATGAPGARAAQLTLADNADGATAPALRATVAPEPAPPAQPTPTPPALAPPVTTTPVPTPKAPPTPTACSSRRKLTLSKSLTRSIRSGTAKLNGKVIARLSPRRRTITIDLRGKRAGTYTLRVTIKTKAGRTVKLTRKYKTCALKPA